MADEPIIDTPQYALGAVLAQLEDFNPTVARGVLLDALGSYSQFDDRDHVKWHLAQTQVALADLHHVASEEGGLTGAFRDGVFGLASALEALAALAGLDLT